MTASSARELGVAFPAAAMEALEASIFVITSSTAIQLQVIQPNHS